MYLDKLLLIFPIRIIFPIFIGVVFAVAGFLFGYYEISQSTKKIEKEKLTEICRLTASFQEEVEYLNEKENVEFLERKLINISSDPYIDLIFVASPTGKIILSSKRKYINEKFIKPLKDVAPHSYKNIMNIIKKFDKNTGIFCKITDEGKIVAVSPVLFSLKKEEIRPSDIGFVFLSYRLYDVLDRHKKEILLKLAAQFSLLFFVFILVYTGFNKMVGERINTIISAVNRISRGELDVKIHLKGKDEFALIASVINNLVDRLNRYIKYDYLTGLLNRFGLENEIGKLLETNKNLWSIFIFIDLDNFKEINDTFGHDVGDILLKKFAKRLKLLAEGKIVGRLGGDEFIVFFQSQEKPEIQKMMSNWIEQLSGDIQIDGQMIQVTLTAGVSIKRSDQTNFYDLLKESDIALYYGKKKGKKLFVVFDETLRFKEERRILLTDILKKSLKNGNFFLVYQPIISLKTGKIVSVEALLRMKNTEIGEISPSEFIPILEETGMIKEVGYWVLSQACRQIKIWEKEGIKDISVSVNVDIQQIMDRDFVKNVKSILSEHNVKPDKIRLELTESEAMKFPKTVLKVLKKLTEYGIKIAIDDFGTGYSSLSYLKMMPVSYIKIDRSFVKNIPESKSDNILVVSIINLSKSFGYRTIAEGVEKEDQLTFLKNAGCDCVQGFYFSKPVPPHQIKEIYKKEFSDVY
ncbi:EAL domain-containing protein [Persephonella sp.]|nr:EAL domain-containing protein [Persephonella sp.]